MFLVYSLVEYRTSIQSDCDSVSLSTHLALCNRCTHSSETNTRRTQTPLMTRIQPQSSEVERLTLYRPNQRRLFICSFTMANYFQLVTYFTAHAFLESNGGEVSARRYTTNLQFKYLCSRNGSCKHITHIKMLALCSVAMSHSSIASSF